MQYIESESVELKEKVNDKLTKEIVSFLNANGGNIYIGVNDDGIVVGVNNIDEIMRKIAESITAQIEPIPQELIHNEVIYENNKYIINIKIDKGIEPIYCIKKYGFSSLGCPIRIGTTCMEMTQVQIKQRYEQRFFSSDLIVSAPSHRVGLTFQTLKNYYIEKGYKLNEETFKKNLFLVNEKNQENIMAELLADDNSFSLIFVKFNGTDKSSISQRNNYGNQSILFAYEQLMNRVIAENICISNTSVRPRVDKFLFDIDSVNEAIINAIVHNDWSITEPQISFFLDRIEILSHGGLPYGLSKNDFYEGFSKPRNMKLMRIFSDLDIVDHTGHGVPIIVSKYGKEAFNITSNYIKVTIPFDKEVAQSKNVGMNVGMDVGMNDIIKLTDTDEEVVKNIILNPVITANELSKLLGKSSRTIDRSISKLKSFGMLVRIGSKQNGHWKIIK